MAPGFWTLGCGPGFYATRIAQLFRLFSGASAFLARRARSSAVPLGGESPPFQTGATLQHFRGTRVGRPAKLGPNQQQEVIRTVRGGSRTAADAARLFGLHRIV